MSTMGHASICVRFAMSYILLTPIRDEAINLESLAQSVFGQTIKPVLWVIAIDSNCVDRSYETACKIFEGHEWVSVFERRDRADCLYSHLSFAKTLNFAYECALETCRSRQLEFDMIGKTDASVLLEKDYFQRLIEVLTSNSNIAFACGIQHLRVGGKTIISPVNQTDRMQGLNDIRLYRRDFFEGVGGYPVTPSPDAVLFVKAIRNGWDVEVSNRTFFVKKRLGGSKPGIWNGYKLKGRCMYYLGYHPFLACALSAYHSFKMPPHYQGIAEFYGFLASALSLDERIPDPQIIDYFWRIRPKEVIVASLKHRGRET